MDRAVGRFLSLGDLYAPERFGGSERVMLELSKALIRSGCEAGIMAGGRERRWPDFHNGVHEWRYPIMISPIPLMAFSSMIRFRRMAELPLVAERGTVLIHHPISGWAADRSGLLHNRDSIAFFYGRVDEEWQWQWRGTASGGLRSAASPLASAILPRILRRIQVSVLRRARSVVVLGHYTYHEAKRLMGDGRDEPNLIRPGVDLERFKPTENKNASKRRLGIDPRVPVVLSVRRLVPRMGLDLLIDALPLIKTVHPRIQLIIAGQGSLRDQLIQRAERLDVSENVTFCGFVPEEELPLYYRAADLFVLPSGALEGFGLVTLEAMASGVPVVGTRTGETPYLIDETRGVGKVLDAATPEALAHACCEFLSSSEDRGSACRAYASTFTWDNFAAAIISLAEGC